ncbi:MAG: carbohydrate-binding family 9-like protein [Chryseolinea sp.]
MNTNGFTIWCACVFVVLLPESMFAQKLNKAEGKKAMLTIKHTNDFDVSGDTSATVWNATAWITLPKRNPSAINYHTKVKLLYSDKGIYTLFYCEDKKITATLKEDFADLFNEDVVEIFFWPDEQIPIYFEYELSPLDYELAILVPNMKGKFLGWRPWHYFGDRKTQHVARIIKEGENTVGWIAEFFLPYTLLTPLNNVPPKRGTTWRVNIYRIDYDNGDNEWEWQPTTTTFHDYGRFGTLVFD